MANPEAPVVSSKERCLTFEEWNAIMPEVQDISHELPDSFLVVGQKMRARIIWKGTRYDVSAWQTGPDKGSCYVILRQL